LYLHTSQNALNLKVYKKKAVSEFEKKLAELKILQILALVIDRS